MKKLTRREFLRIAGLTAASATALTALEACAPAATPAPTPAPATQPPAAPTATPVPTKPPAKTGKIVEFFAWGGPTDIPMWDVMAKNFMKQNPDFLIKISIGPWGGALGTEYYTKLQTQIAGGAPPDIAGFQGWEWQPFADKGILVPIEDYIKRDNFTDPWPDFPVVHTTCERKGHTWHIPLQMGTMVMFYAKKHFDEAGIPYPTDDWTMEEFLDIAQKLTKTSGNVKRWGYQANGNWYRDIHWIRSTGKQEFDTLVDPHKAQFNQPEIVDIVQLVASDVYYKLKISPTPADLEGGANTIDTGNCAMKYEGAWYFPNLMSPKLQEEGKAVPFDVVMMPKGADPNRPHRGWSEGVNILKTGREDDAWEFAKYMAGPEGNKIHSEITGRIPNSPKLVEEFWLPMIKEKFGVQNGRAFLEAFKRAQVDVIGGVPRSKMWAEVVKPVAWDPLTQGTAKAADVLPEVDKKLQALLDEYWKEQG